ncbi:hypothetical protein AAF712_010423 [Marasmius tenuissimus]|uniref:Uncharacterized protein n=1 Tax=Marasmius tenuissimus TaxID=585030 RepID=A0ABR2ZN10_9AGAR
MAALRPETKNRAGLASDPPEILEEGGSGSHQHHHHHRRLPPSTSEDVWRTLNGL